MYQSNEIKDDDEVLQNLNPEQADENLDDEALEEEYLEEDDLDYDENELPNDSQIVIGDDEIDEVEQLDLREQGVSKPHPSDETYGTNSLTNTN